MEHPAIRLIDRTEDVIAGVLCSRAVSTTLLYLAGGMLIDLSAKKLIVLCIIVFTVYRLKFGQRRLEQLGFLFLMAATVIWLGIVPSLEGIAQIKPCGATAIPS